MWCFQDVTNKLARVWCFQNKTNKSNSCSMAKVRCFYITSKLGIVWLFMMSQINWLLNVFMMIQIDLRTKNVSHATNGIHYRYIQQHDVSMNNLTVVRPFFIFQMNGLRIVALCLYFTHELTKVWCFDICHKWIDLVMILYITNELNNWLKIAACNLNLAWLTDLH